MPPSLAHRRLAAHLALVAAAVILSFAALAATAPRADAVAHRTGHCGPPSRSATSTAGTARCGEAGSRVNEPGQRARLADSAITVGHLVHGGRANWFAGQVYDGSSFFVLPAT